MHQTKQNLKGLQPPESYMTKYLNTVTGEIVSVYPWTSRKRKEEITENPKIYMQMFEGSATW